MTATSPWLPMGIAPRDRRITIQAERWVSGHERMRVEAFAGCKRSEGGSVRHPAPYWRGVPPGWTPTGWREAEQDRDSETAGRASTSMTQPAGAGARR